MEINSHIGTSPLDVVVWRSTNERQLFVECTLVRTAAASSESAASYLTLVVYKCSFQLDFGIQTYQ